MNTYIYKLKLKTYYQNDEAWTKETEEVINKHFLRLKQDFEKGLLKHVGRTKDPKGEGFGLVIFDAVSLQEATTYMNDDPAIKAGIMTGEVFEYKWIF